MKNRFACLLEKAGVSEYRITETSVESTELFFIKKKLDMRRMKNSTNVTIDVFKDIEEDGNKFKGLSEIIGNPSMSDDEWLDKIKSALYSAGFVKNKTYTLPEGEKSDEIVMESDLSDMSLSEIADKFVEAIYEEDNDSKSFINSLEVFSERKHVKMIGSNGTDVSYVKTSFKGEFVVQCKEPMDVETYQNFEYDSLNLSDIKSLVKRTITLTKDRARANETPSTGNYDIVISHKYMADLFGFYLERANAAYIYAGYSEYKKGDNIQGEDVKGEKLNIDFLPDVPFDEQAIRKTVCPFIEEGKLKLIHGGIRFCEYIGVDKVGIYSKVRVKNGSVSFDDMLKRPCIHVVNFSDFQVDSFDGHFKGEIRLGYLYDGKGNVTPITGGSINGSFIEAQRDFSFSKETQKLSTYEGPMALFIKNVPVAGK